jgi:hypothetical protein
MNAHDVLDANPELPKNYNYIIVDRGKTVPQDQRYHGLRLRDNYSFFVASITSWKNAKAKSGLSAYFIQSDEARAMSIKYLRKYLCGKSWEYRGFTLRLSDIEARGEKFIRCTFWIYAHTTPNNFGTALTRTECIVDRKTAGKKEFTPVVSADLKIEWTRYPFTKEERVSLEDIAQEQIRSASREYSHARKEYEAAETELKNTTRIFGPFITTSKTLEKRGSND